MFDALSVPPRLVLRALDDLHTLAESVRSLADGDLLDDLLLSIRAVPRSEDDLSERVDLLRAEIAALRDWLGPLHRELKDLDDTAEALAAGLGRLEALLKKLPGL
jgi:hypothetical protein